MTIAVLFILFFVAAVVIGRSIKVVPAGKQAVIYRLGRIVPNAKSAGIVIAVPFIDQVTFVDTTDRSVDMERVVAITHDNQSVTLEGTVRFRIFDPEAASSHVSDVDSAVATLAQTSVRQTVGEIQHSEVFERSAGERIRVKMETAAKPWGISIVDVSVRRGLGFK